MASDATTAGRHRPDRPRPVPGLAVLAAAAVLAVGGDVVGLVAGEAGEPLLADLTGPVVAGLVVLVRVAAGTPYAFVVGQVGLVVGLDGGPTTTPVAQAVLVGLLVDDVAAGRTPRDATRTALVATATAVGLFAILEYADGTLVAGAAVLAATALAGYTIHRYERLSLGLVGDSG